MSNQDYFIDLLIDNVNELFELTFDNGKEIIRDNRSDVANEIINMLFKEVLDLQENANQVNIFDITFDSQYINKQPNINEITVKSNKKQKDIVKLFEYIINIVVGKLNNISVDGKSILKSSKKRLEKAINIRFNMVSDFLQSSSNYDDIIWNQALFDNIRSNINEDIKRALYKPSGVKGQGNCSRCKSDNLYVVTKQTSSGDESTSVFYTCMDCSFRWMIK